MNWEFVFLEKLQELFKGNAADAFFTFVTHLGDKGIVWIALSVILLIFRRTRPAGLAIAAALLIGVLVGNLTLKPVIARVRPYDIADNISLLISAPKDYSFPSGHTLSSFAAATALFGFERKAGTAAFALALLIAFSRLYLYVHFPTDIIAGIIIGIASGIAGILISKHIFRRIGKK